MTRSVRTPVVAGNWKMNGDRATVAALVEDVRAGLDNLVGVEIVLLPPFVFIPQVAAALAIGSGIAWGAQNMEAHDGGAFTGEIAAPMLRQFGCDYVILGHSERRRLFAETDQAVADKVAVAVAAGLIAVLCVGETLAERDAGNLEQVVERQLDAVITRCGIAALARCIIAYEPVWAIGTGRTARPAQAQAAHALIRRLIAEHDQAIAASLRILHGGSIKATNAAALFAEPDIDGGLIGGASLDAAEFLAICRAAL